MARPVVGELLQGFRWSRSCCAPTAGRTATESPNCQRPEKVGAVRKMCRPARSAVQLAETVRLFVWEF